MCAGSQASRQTRRRRRARCASQRLVNDGAAMPPAGSPRLTAVSAGAPRDSSSLGRCAGWGTGARETIVPTTILRRAGQRGVLAAGRGARRCVCWWSRRPPIAFRARCTTASRRIYSRRTWPGARAALFRADRLGVGHGGPEQPVAVAACLRIRSGARRGLCAAPKWRKKAGDRRCAPPVAERNGHLARWGSNPPGRPAAADG